MAVERSLGDPGGPADLVDVHIGVPPAGEGVDRCVQQSRGGGSPAPPPHLDPHRPVPHLRPERLVPLQSEKVREHPADDPQGEPAALAEDTDQPQGLDVPLVVQEPVGGRPAGGREQAQAQVRGGSKGLASQAKSGRAP